jgi:calcium permeable stress-gated cation channel
MDMSVESASVCKQVGTLKLLDKRAGTSLVLEAAWVRYVGNPSSLDRTSAVPLLNDTEAAALESQHGRLAAPHRKRPTLRAGWFTPRCVTYSTIFSAKYQVSAKQHHSTQCDNNPGANKTPI